MLTTGKISSEELADNAITTSKITDGSVTTSKLASGSAVGNIGYTPAKVTVGASSPASPQSGDWWFDTTVNRMKYFNGTTWIDPLKYQ